MLRLNSTEVGVHTDPMSIKVLELQLEAKRGGAGPKSAERLGKQAPRRTVRVC